MPHRARLLPLVTALTLGASNLASAETADGSKMQFNFTEDGKNFIRFLTWHQIWVRYMDMNPATRMHGRPIDDTADIGIRRSRFLLFGRVADRLTMVFHFGINHQTINNARKPQLYVHDVWLDFEVVPKYLSLGAGLHYWNGISRMTNWSTLKFLSLDAPISNWPVIEKSDQFARQLGLFAHGQAVGLDYRFALNRPFQVGDASLATFPAGQPDFNPTNNDPAYAGYVMYQFLEKEGNLLPYLPGTYIGAKRVFNLGSGFYYHPNQMRQRDPTGIEPDELYDGLVVAGDAFLDLPFGEKAEGGALTAYAAYYYVDFGPDYVRNVGIMNIGTQDAMIATNPDGGPFLGGGGNAFPIIGTGHQFYTQVGYLLPFDILGTQLQPYATLQISDFEAYDELAITPEWGFNWFIHGHNAKLTFLHRFRPFFARENADPGADAVVDSYHQELIVQGQLMY